MTNILKKFKQENRMAYSQDYFLKNLEIGQTYQDYVAILLHDVKSISLNIFTSRWAQKHCESLSYHEIKYDQFVYPCEISKRISHSISGYSSSFESKENMIIPLFTVPNGIWKDSNPYAVDLSYVKFIDLFHGFDPVEHNKTKQGISRHLQGYIRGNYSLTFYVSNPQILQKYIIDSLLSGLVEEEYGLTFSNISRIKTKKNQNDTVYYVLITKQELLQLEKKLYIIERILPLELPGFLETLKRKNIQLYSFLFNEKQ